MSHLQEAPILLYSCGILRRFHNHVHDRRKFNICSGKVIMNDGSRKEIADWNNMAIGGVIVLGIGLLFLLINLQILPPMRKLWPAILIVVGLALIIGSLTRKRKEDKTGPL